MVIVTFVLLVPCRSAFFFDAVKILPHVQCAAKRYEGQSAPKFKRMFLGIEDVYSKNTLQLEQETSWMECTILTY